MNKFSILFLLILTIINTCYSIDSLDVIKSRIDLGAEDTMGPDPFDKTCPAVLQVEVSSSLKASGSLSYDKSKLYDKNRSTAWVEGKAGYGIGEFIEFKILTIDNFKDGSFFGNFLIVNGYAKNKTLWENNSRVKTFRCYLNNTPIADLSLIDTDRYQEFRIPGYEKFKIGDKLRFEIRSTYNGNLYDDTAISIFMPTCHP
jgi:hypothetical protein